jgi:aryl-alcohol dehydrogenase-like predicted oxidoreductase
MRPVANWVFSSKAAGRIRSEEIVGKAVADHHLSSRVLIATKPGLAVPRSPRRPDAVGQQVRRQ